MRDQAGNAGRRLVWAVTSTARHAAAVHNDPKIKNVVSRAVETGEVTPGLSSVAAAVLDHNGHPLATDVRRSAGLLSTRLGGGPRPA